MKLSVGDPEANSSNWLVVDLDKRETINHVICADDESGEYECLIEESPGRFKMENFESFATIKKIGNIKLIKNLHKYPSVAGRPS